MTLTDDVVPAPIFRTINLCFFLCYFNDTY